MEIMENMFHKKKGKQQNHVSSRVMHEFNAMIFDVVFMDYLQGLLSFGRPPYGLVSKD